MLQEIEILIVSDEPFTIKDILYNTGLVGYMHEKILRRLLNKEKIKYLNLRKKGILYKEYLVK